MGQQVKFVLNFENNLELQSTFTVVILDNAGNTKFYTRTQKSNLIICCVGCDFVVKVTCESGGSVQTISRFVYCAPCELFMNFSFHFAPQNESLQSFILLDSTYNFPVGKATLFFKPR